MQECTDKDLENINSIDMECDCGEDDDKGFVLNNKKSSEIIAEENSKNFTPESVVKTGITIDFNKADEDDLEYHPMKKITADVNELGNIQIKKNFSSNANTQNEDMSDINPIDMECNCSEDDGEPIVTASAQNNNIVNFDTDDEDDTKELVDETIINEKKKKRCTPGEVEDNYWKNIAKKHAESNTKGSYNTSFHFAGNPKMEADMFNHENAGEPMPTFNNDISASSNAIEAPASTPFTGAGTSGEAGCSESLENTYTKKLKSMFSVIGFNVIKNKDGYHATDIYGEDNSIDCPDLNSLIDNLKPYIEDCFIIPLEIKTNKNFQSYAEWCDWYKIDNNQKEFEKCKEDIDICELLAYHIKECEL